MKKFILVSGIFITFIISAAFLSFESDYQNAIAELNNGCYSDAAAFLKKTDKSFFKRDDALYYLIDAGTYLEKGKLAEADRSLSEFEKYGSEEAAMPLCERLREEIDRQYEEKRKAEQEFFEEVLKNYDPSLKPRNFEQEEKPKYRPSRPGKYDCDDPYNAKDYYNAEQFYEYYYYEFSDFYDAENYYNEHCE